MREALLPTLTSETRKMARKLQTPRVAQNFAGILFRKNSDLLPELALDGPEFARYAVSAIPAHLLVTAVGLRRGFSPDAQKNLTPAVVLSCKENPPAKRSGA